MRGTYQALTGYNTPLCYNSLSGAMHYISTSLLYIYPGTARIRSIVIMYALCMIIWVERCPKAFPTNAPTMALIEMSKDDPSPLLIQRRRYAIMLFSIMETTSGLDQIWWRSDTPEEYDSISRD